MKRVSLPLGHFGQFRLAAVVGALAIALPFLLTERAPAQTEEQQMQEEIATWEARISSRQQELIELLSKPATGASGAEADKIRNEIMQTRKHVESLNDRLGQARTNAAERNRQQELARLNEAIAKRDAQVQTLSDQLAAMERERETPAGNAELRVFPLKYLDARSASMTVGEIVGGQGVRSSVNVRTNALIVSAPPEKIEVIRSLLEILDVENRAGANAEAGQGPRSLLVRVFWLADNLPEGEGQDPAAHLPASVLKAVQGVGLESPRIVSQVVNSAVNVMGDGQSPPFLSSTSVLVGGRNTRERCSGTLRVAGDREVVLQLSVQLENSCQIEGNLTMPIGHYMVLGTANSLISDAVANPRMDRLRNEVERNLREGDGRDGFDGGRDGYGGRGGEFDGGRGGYGATGEGGFGEAEPGTVGQAPGQFKTSRFAFVVQVVEAESFAPEK